MDGEDLKAEAAAATGEMAGSPEQSSDGTGVARSFDCTFCKRGFSNAQALGGHMNIHRKERARVRPDPTPSEAAWYYAAYSSRRHRPFHPTASDLLKNFTLCFPESMTVNHGGGVRDSHNHMHQKLPTRELSLFGGEGLLGSRMVLSGDGGEDGGEMKRPKEDGGLDLELRLGLVP